MKSHSTSQLLNTCKHHTIQISISSYNYFCRLSEVSLESAEYSEVIGHYAYEVEQCECPPQYAGTSCQVKLKAQKTLLSSKISFLNIDNYCTHNAKSQPGDGT